jgi:acyl-coenzyme A synthetase/AMP-(fatty) acid ligase
VLRHEDFEDHDESVGRAVLGGHFSILGIDGQSVEAGIEGEVIFYGPNVMSGYAETFDDLWLEDSLNGRLATGDRGFLDENGYLWLTGRDKRIAKVFGTRVGLDEIEELVATWGYTVAAVSGEECLVVFIEGKGDDIVIRDAIAKHLKLHRSGVLVQPVERLPLLENGKIDYKTLSRSREGNLA